MIGSKRNTNQATAYPGGDAQDRPPATAKNGKQNGCPRGVLQHQPRLQLKKQVVRIGTWNVGSMTGRGRELVDVMMRRNVDIACVQETRWKGNCARELGSGYKLIYAGCSTRNGVGVILSAEYAKKVTKVDRFSDRLILVQVEYYISLSTMVRSGILYQLMHHK